MLWGHSLFSLRPPTIPSLLLVRRSRKCRPEWWEKNKKETERVKIGGPNGELETVRNVRKRHERMEREENRVGMAGKGKRHWGKFEVALRCSRGGGGGLQQTGSTGNSGDAGVQPSIKCNLMLQGMFTCYVSDSRLAFRECPVLINDFNVFLPMPFCNS